MTTDTNKLMALAACLRCIPKAMQREVLLYLFIAIANKWPKH